MPGRPLPEELYLLKVWSDDVARRREAHVPEEATFSTRPQLAMRMVTRALDAPGGLEPDWVLGDEVYSNHRMRRVLEDRGRAYVLAVWSGQRLRVDWRQVPVKRVADGIPQAHWWPWSVAEGAKGPRVYEWAAATLGVPTESGVIRWLLIRRHVEDPSDRAYYSLRCPAARNRPGPGDGGGEAVCDRVVLRGGQGGDGPRRVRGADPARLVPARDALDAGAGLPGGGAAEANQTPPAKKGELIRKGMIRGVRLSTTRLQPA